MKACFVFVLAVSSKGMVKKMWIYPHFGWVGQDGDKTGSWVAAVDGSSGLQWVAR